MRTRHLALLLALATGAVIDMQSTSDSVPVPGPTT
jgi:hypothetical protein